MGVGIRPLPVISPYSFRGCVNLGFKLKAFWKFWVGVVSFSSIRKLAVDVNVKVDVNVDGTASYPSRSRDLEVVPELNILKLSWTKLVVLLAALCRWQNDDVTHAANHNALQHTPYDLPSSIIGSSHMYSHTWHENSMKICHRNPLKTSISDVRKRKERKFFKEFLIFRMWNFVVEFVF